MPCSLHDQSIRILQRIHLLLRCGEEHITFVAFFDLCEKLSGTVGIEYYGHIRVLCLIGGLHILHDCIEAGGNKHLDLHRFCLCCLLFGLLLRLLPGTLLSLLCRLLHSFLLCLFTVGALCSVCGISAAACKKREY